MPKTKPTIGQLKDLMKSESTCPVEILPDGTIKRPKKSCRHPYLTTTKWLNFMVCRSCGQSWEKDRTATGTIWRRCHHAQE